MSSTPSDIYSSEPGIPHGSRIVTITRNGTPTAYFCDSFSPSYPSKRMAQNDNLGRAARFKLAKDFPTASATLQLATDTTPIPAQHEIIPAAVGDLCTHWVIESVSPPEEAESIRTVQVTLVGVPLPRAT